jgi:hypothetical protein
MVVRLIFCYFRLYFHDFSIVGQKYVLGAKFYTEFDFSLSVRFSFWMNFPKFCLKTRRWRWIRWQNLIRQLTNTSARLLNCFLSIQDLYRNESFKIMRIYQRFAPLCERASIDEAYLDITEPVQKLFDEFRSRVSLSWILSFGFPLSLSSNTNSHNFYSCKPKCQMAFLEPSRAYLNDSKLLWQWW